MTKYAVIKMKGTQYKVSEGDEILVDKVGEEKLEPEVLLVADGDKISVGKPKVPGAKITIKTLMEEEKGEKISILKYKAKSRYRKRLGFRPKYTRLLITAIKNTPRL